MSLDSPWYLTAYAVRGYLQIAQMHDDGGPQWGRAERELAAHARAARHVSTTGGTQVYRTGRVRCGDREQAVRLELVVRTTPRPEGPLPQLVRVAAKTGQRGRR